MLCYSHPYPCIPDISFSLDGVENTFDVKKATGPDDISGQILKLCSAEIAPVLNVIFTQSLNTAW